MSREPVKLLFGAWPVGNEEPLISREGLEKVISSLKKFGIHEIDTAHTYGNSEQRLREIKAGDHFSIDTKWAGGVAVPGSLQRDNMIASAKDSIRKLGVKNVDIFYIHTPDAGQPFEDVCATVNEVHQMGLFKRFGLSNYYVEDVQKMHDICKKNSYILPSVYQGNYSAVARKAETELFPTLRRNNISFYAYGPFAGGFLTKTRRQIEENRHGRFSQEVLGGMYLRLYGKPSYLEALDRWGQIAKEEGCSQAELACRWVAYDSPLSKELGDGMLIGASKPSQLDQTLEGLARGPLSDKAVKEIDGIWESVKDDAPLNIIEEYMNK